MSVLRRNWATVVTNWPTWAVSSTIWRSALPRLSHRKSACWPISPTNCARLLARLTVALALARKNTTTKGESALDRIEMESERVNALVGQLLALTRLESGAERVPPEMVALEELVEEVIDDANYEAKPLHKEVRVLQLSPCRVRGSSELLRSGIENVIRNAIRYTAEGTAVEVSLSTRLDNAIVTVRDHGPGVPDSELQHIFEPFYRVGEARERSSGGVGLGLSIADRTIKLHGGTIRAENVNDGLLITIGHSALGVCPLWFSLRLREYRWLRGAGLGKERCRRDP